jgi:hypothetical protein
MDTIPKGLIKLNSNGALKGNLGPSEVWGFFHNTEAKITSLITYKLGFNTNNGEEL